MLQSDPFEVEVGSGDYSEKFLLEPIDRTKDVPNSWKSVRRVMKLMGESEIARRRARAQRKSKDGQTQETQAQVEEFAGKVRRNEFDNLLPLLAGMRNSGRHWKLWQWEIVARMAGENDAAYALVEAARQAEETGLYLYDLRIIREVIWACRLHAASSQWSAEKCAKALGYLEELARLMEDPVQKREEQRAINKGILDGKLNPLKQADVIGVAVELAAKRVEALEDEETEEVLIHARTNLHNYLHRLLPNIDNAIDESAKAVAEAEPLGMVADYELLRWVPVLHGLKTVQSALKSKNTTDLGDYIERVSKRVQDARNTVIDSVGGDEGGKRRGLIWCESARLV